jgi:dTDP-glucose 4,6-dehydratase
MPSVVEDHRYERPEVALVTGGLGFIGSHLVRTLIEQGFCVVNIDNRTYASDAGAHVGLQGGGRYHEVVADICDRGVIADCFSRYRPRLLFHLAAESHVDRSIDEPYAFVETNVMGTVVLLDCARSFLDEEPPECRGSFRFIHVSTDEVYGSLGAIGSFNERTRYSPRSPYSASKASSDHFARAWHHTFGVPVLVTNCSNNYGPRQFPEKLIPVAIIHALLDMEIPVYGAGENVRDWVHVEDHCDALLKVAMKGRVGETYNIGGSNEISNIKLVRTLCRLLDKLKPRSDGSSYANQIRFVVDRPGHDMRYSVDAGKIMRELGWAPRYRRDEGLVATVRWYLENRHWWEPIVARKNQLVRRGLLGEI